MVTETKKTVTITIINKWTESKTVLKAQKVRRDLFEMTIMLKAAKKTAVAGVERNTDWEVVAERHRDRLEQYAEALAYIDAMPMMQY